MATTQYRRINFRIERSQFDAFEARCAEEGVSVHEQIRRLCASFLAGPTWEGLQQSLERVCAQLEADPQLHFFKSENELRANTQFCALVLKMLAATQLPPEKQHALKAEWDAQMRALSARTGG